MLLLSWDTLGKIYGFKKSDGFLYILHKKKPMYNFVAFQNGGRVIPKCFTETLSRIKQLFINHFSPRILCYLFRTSPYFYLLSDHHSKYDL